MASTMARTLSMVFPAVLKHQRAKKKEKILQFGERVFGVTEGTDDARIDDIIAKIVAFFHAMEVPASLPEAELTAQNIDPIVEQLKAHKRDKLGEHGAISYEDSRDILKLAV